MDNRASQKARAGAEGVKQEHNHGYFFSDLRDADAVMIFFAKK
jgi:hypothetical protein